MNNNIDLCRNFKKVGTHNIDPYRNIGPCRDVRKIGTRIIIRLEI
jgi:hypothetical protein